MKKFIIAFVTVIALFSLTAQAEVGDTQFIVIKNGDNVTIYIIKDRGENMYGNKDAFVDVKDFVNPAVRDLRACEVPEEAWKMCSMYENGVYSSQASRLSQTLQEVKIDYENEVENTRYLEDSAMWSKFYIVIVAGGAGVIIINQNRAIKKLQHNQK